MPGRMMKKGPNMGHKKGPKMGHKKGPKMGHKKGPKMHPMPKKGAKMYGKKK